MKIHEYQAKGLFRRYDIPVPEGGAAFSVDQALNRAGDLDTFPVVIKAQIHAGGRGKGGGVRFAFSMEEVEKEASRILGMSLVTRQTGPEGKLVKRLLIEAGQKIEKELYLSLVIDRKAAGIIIVASRNGGMDIEKVAEENSESIIKIPVDPLMGIQAYQLRELVFRLELSSPAAKEFSRLLSGLYRFFIENDCSLVEINPLILIPGDHLLVLDAKVDFDSNALYRHKDLLELRDLDQEDPMEIEASKFNLNYINLDGNVGNIVNGAGLAMATMDMIKNQGVSPANFMDVGGGANSEQVENAFRIILSDPKVKAVLINIFGGILRCDVFARGIVEAVKRTGVNVPVIIRMEGTNVEQGKKILSEAGLGLESVDDLSEAAQRIAATVN